MGVMPELSKAVQEMDWILPTDIQGEAVPLILGGGDVLMAAETGSGKTGAFCLPVIQIVYETLKNLQSGKHTGGHAGGVKQPFKLNPNDRTEAMAIDADGLLCQSRDPGGWHGARANRGVKNSGKYYYEAVVTDDGLCRVGWSTLRASHDVGTDAESFGFGGTGKMSHRRQFDSYGESFGKGDCVGCFLDLNNGTISWSKNGKLFGKAYDVPAPLRSAGLFPSVCLKNAEIRFNFGATAFTHSHQPAGSSVANRFVPKPNAPLALIMEPSRELAEQTCEQIRKFKRYLKDPCPRELLIIGGGDTKRQMDALHSGVSTALLDCRVFYLYLHALSGALARLPSTTHGYSLLLTSSMNFVNFLPECAHIRNVRLQGWLTFGHRRVDIVVATPGRLDDLLSTGTLSLSNCRFFILDECDGLLSAGYGDMITRLHSQIPKVTPDGGRLQMVVCSATLHSFEVKKLANKLMHFPVWIDLKGQDSVPETVHHVVCHVDPYKDESWKEKMGQPQGHIQTDGVHLKDRCHPGDPSAETLSEAVKLLKGDYVVRAIKQQKMDRALIFCRTKLDCDNLEQYFVSLGGAERKANLQKFK
ncbi:DEAD/DEAH box helicase, partial [Opisthorchis viverrini]